MQGDIREQYTIGLKDFFGADQMRIQHALQVLHFAERIMEGEDVDDTMRKVVTITALLHDVGIKIAEQKYNSSAGNYQELEGPPIVREMMTQQNEPENIIQRVAYIVGGHHTSAKNDGLDFQIIWEADLLVNIKAEKLDADMERLKGIISKNIRTSTGMRLVRELYPHLP